MSDARRSVLSPGRPLARLSHRAGQWRCWWAAARIRRHCGCSGRWLRTARAGREGRQLWCMRRSCLSQNAAKQFRRCLPRCLGQRLQFGFAPHRHAMQQLRGSDRPCRWRPVSGRHTSPKQERPEHTEEQASTQPAPASSENRAPIRAQSSGEGQLHK